MDSCCNALDERNYEFRFNKIPGYWDNPGGGACFHWTILQWLRRQEDPLEEGFIEEFRKKLRGTKKGEKIKYGTQSRFAKTPLKVWYKFLQEAAQVRAMETPSANVLPPAIVPAGVTQDDEELQALLASAAAASDTWEQFAAALEDRNMDDWAGPELIQLTADLLGRDIVVKLIPIVWEKGKIAGVSDEVNEVAVRNMRVGNPELVVSSAHGSEALPRIELALLYDPTEGDLPQGHHYQLKVPADEVSAAQPEGQAAPDETTPEGIFELLERFWGPASTEGTLAHAQLKLDKIDERLASRKTKATEAARKLAILALETLRSEELRLLSLLEDLLN